MKTKIWRLVFIVVGLWFLSFPVLAEAKTIKIAWDANTDGATGYKVYWSYNKLEVVNKTVTPIDVGNRLCYCFEANEAYPAVYFGVTAYNATAESGITTGNDLFGNINGDNVFNYGVAWGDTRVDGADLTILGLYFGQTVVHSNFDCNSCSYISGGWPPTDLQKADIKKDGANRIDGFDLIELGLRFGNATQ